MNTDALKQFIEEELKRVEEYGESLRAEMAQLDSAVFRHLNFFNMGYHYALENILDGISPPEGADDES